MKRQTLRERFGSYITTQDPLIIAWGEQTWSNMLHEDGMEIVASMNNARNNPLAVPDIHAMIEERILPTIQRTSRYDLRNEYLGDDDSLSELDESFRSIFAQYDIHTRVLSGMLVARPMTAGEKDAYQQQLQQRSQSQIAPSVDDEEAASMELIQMLLEIGEVGF